MADLMEIADRLPALARLELQDFAEFLQRKYHPSESWPERIDWQAMTETSSSSVWANDEDDVYGQLL